MENLKKLEKIFRKKIKKGASLVIRKKYLYIFEDQNLIFETKFSLNQYLKLGRYTTLQLEASINGKPHVIASVQSAEGRQNLKTLFELIEEYKKIKNCLETLKNIEEMEAKLKKVKFLKKTKRG